MASEIYYPVLMRRGPSGLQRLIKRQGCESKERAMAVAESIKEPGDIAAATLKSKASASGDRRGAAWIE